jgi:preprotein translocase subunit YajC
VSSLIIIAAMFVLLWALLIRPQKAKQQAQQRMISEAAPGDEVLTVGGIYGIVVAIDEEDEDDLVVEIADGIHVRMARRAIAAVVKAEDEDEDDDDGFEDATDGDAGDAGDDEDVVEGSAEEEPGLVTVPDEEASVEATQRRLFRRR